MAMENENVEFKRSFVDDIKKTVIAFANTTGGKIYIGIEDNGNVRGVQDEDDVILKTSNIIRDSIKPDVTLFTNCYCETRNDKKVIVVSVQKGTSCPYYLASKGIRPEGVYVRQGAASVPASESSIIQMIKDTSGESYEELRSINQELTFESLNNEFQEAGIPFGMAQRKTFGFIKEDGLFSNLALLLSDQCIHTIKIAVFEGTNKSVFKDRYEFQGSLFQQMHECYAFIDRYNRTSSNFNGLKRIDQREYPTSAIRETLMNSIVHRDYAFSGSTLISIFDDHMEFVTIGGLVKGISKEDMLLGVSILRNKNLANVFYRLKLIEAFGTGIPKIIDSYEECEYKPKIEVTQNAFKITLYNKLLNMNVALNKESSIENLPDNERRIVQLLNNQNAIKRSDVEKLLSISQPMAVNHLNALLRKNILVKVGNGKNTQYKMK